MSGQLGVLLGRCTTTLVEPLATGFLCAMQAALVATSATPSLSCVVVAGLPKELLLLGSASTVWVIPAQPMVQLATVLHAGAFGIPLVWLG